MKTQKSAYNINDNIPDIISIVPTMDIVVFPNMIVPLLVIDEKVINGINKSLENDHKLVLLLACKKNGDNFSQIGINDLYLVGTIASIMRVIKLPEGGIKILVQGIAKARVIDIISQDNILMANIKQIVFNDDDNDIINNINKIKEIAEKVSLSGHNLSPDFHLILSKMDDPDKISDFVLSHLNLSIEEAQAMLETTTYSQFLSYIYQHLNKEIEINEIQENIKNRARDSMNKSQKEFYLREQLKAIKKELGDDEYDDIEKLRSRLSLLDIPDEIKNEINKQINRLEKTSPDSMEASVIRNHLDWALSLPWNIETKDNLDINYAKKILDEDHFGLKDIKDRILDFISIKNLKNDGYAPILCFVGPPGVGKTSLGQSIAKSLGRKYFRISLGGVKDEAEIRGHRRTYVGAMPGRFIQGIKNAGSKNSIIIIDELDKIGSDFRGDPSAAMLEVLDPNQNKSFYDNYLGFPFDLSKVIFIATANNIDNISDALKDRLEIINLFGYTNEEKLNIAKNYLVKKSIKECGLDGKDIKFDDNLIIDIIKFYTKEAGVRELERTIKKLCSKIARNLVESNKIVSINSENIEEFLGPKKFVDNDYYNISDIGITNGLAWTPYGGQMIKVEAVIMAGKGNLILTGSLGNIMKESAQAALSYAKVHAEEFNIDRSMFEKYDIHIHVPSGAIPKDGPSAGVTILSSIISAFSQRPINSAYAMTGEINLRGNVMAIGGVKEKILAAKQNNILNIILPYQNKKDIIANEEITKDVNIIFVNHANEILNHVLMPSLNISNKFINGDIHKIVNNSIIADEKTEYKNSYDR